jgi:hypothetical protein
VVIGVHQERLKTIRRTWCSRVLREGGEESIEQSQRPPILVRGTSTSQAQAVSVTCKSCLLAESLRQKQWHDRTKVTHRAKDREVIGGLADG